MFLVRMSAVQTILITIMTIVLNQKNKDTNKSK